MTTITNAQAVRFRPQVDVDVDKTSGRVRRIDLDLSESISAELWDYDNNTEPRASDDNPLYKTGERATNEVVIPLLKKAMRQAADELGADYEDGETKTAPPPLIIQHLFTVPVENLNHGRESWLESLIDTCGVDPGPVEQLNEEYPAWLIDYKETTFHAEITVHGTERFLRFLCVLFDLHAEQYPGDLTPAEEARKLERSITVAVAEATNPILYVSVLDLDTTDGCAARWSWDREEALAWVELRDHGLTRAASPQEMLDAVRHIYPDTADEV